MARANATLRLPYLRWLYLFGACFGPGVIGLGCAHHAPSLSPTPYAGTGEDAPITAEQLTCIKAGDRVGDSWYTNVNGHRDQMLQVANAKEGGQYPVGTVVQLLMGEAMVKRGPGFAPETGDWEYIVYKLKDGKTVITDRGTTAVRNPLGTCESCHASAGHFDHVCDKGRGCDPLPELVVKLAHHKAERDPRCSASPAAVTP